ncbi:MAG TPA: hypothetical protein VMZ53_01310 [Kofleriaceae bacterium]|nr:hypothetical protein [Kofleriaceae bacterium]
MRRSLLIAAVLLATTATASAGRSHFGWMYGTDIVPERGVEVESWIVEENHKGDSNSGETAFWWGPVMALTQHVELAISVEAAEEDGSPHFTKWGGDIRYRPQSPDAVDAGPFATKFRLGAKRLILDRAGMRGEADVVASYSAGRVFAQIDAGTIFQHIPDEDEVELRPAAGVSVRAIDDLRFGVEMYSELIVKGEGTSWLTVGPTVSLTSGRFWGAATYGIGLFGIRDAPRVSFGVAL